MDDSRITSFQRAERLLAVGDRTPGGRLLAPLIPLSHLYGLAMRARAALYARGLLRQQILPCRVIRDRKSTRLNSSHGYISYAVFCLKKKKKKMKNT